jgi:hypothetical protein
MNAKAKKQPKAPPYWWFDKETAYALRDQLSAGPIQRLEVRVDADNNMTLHVIQQGVSAASVPLNKSHICPPVCP